MVVTIGSTGMLQAWVGATFFQGPTLQKKKQIECRYFHVEVQCNGGHAPKRKIIIHTQLKGCFLQFTSSHEVTQNKRKVNSFLRRPEVQLMATRFCGIRSPRVLLGNPTLEQFNASGWQIPHFGALKCKKLPTYTASSATKACKTHCCNWNWEVKLVQIWWVMITNGRNPWQESCKSHTPRWVSLWVGCISLSNGKRLIASGVAAIDTLLMFFF